MKHHFTLECGKLELQTNNKSDFGEEILFEKLNLILNCYTVILAFFNLFLIKKSIVTCTSTI
jgi:hypothetical protein